MISMSCLSASFGIPSLPPRPQKQETKIFHESCGILRKWHKHITRAWPATAKRKNTWGVGTGWRYQMQPVLHVHPLSPFIAIWFSSACRLRFLENLVLIPICQNHITKWGYVFKPLRPSRFISNAASEDRAHDLRIMRPTRYQLRYSRLMAGQQESHDGIIAMMNGRQSNGCRQ